MLIKIVKDYDDIPNIDQLPVIDPDVPWIGPEIDIDEKLVVQSGSGLGGTSSLIYAKKLLENLPQYLDTIDNVAFGPIGSSISNKMSEYYNKNPNWKPGFAGEKHLVLPTQHGLTRANFAGPFTKLSKRLARGDTGVDGSKGIDSAAKKHDISYSLAEDYDDIRKADQDFIKDVKESSQNPVLKKAVIGAIKTKTIGEDVGILDKDKYLSEAQKSKFGSGNKESNHGFNIVKDNRTNTRKSPAELLLQKIKKKKKKKKKK